jgi:choice-of-anchor C domain-containing protein
MKKSFILLAVLIGFAFSLAGQRLYAASFMNGSFEVGPPDDGNPFVTLYPGDISIHNWSVVGSDSIDYIGSYWVASDGKKSIDLSGYGPGAIEQTFDTIPDREYLISFDYAGNPGYDTSMPGLNIQSLQASVDSGSQLITEDYTFDAAGQSFSDMGWLSAQFTFTADADTSTIRFSSLTESAFGPALDNVNVSIVPVAPAVLFMLSGLIGITGLGFKKSVTSKDH